ncbi:MAG: lipoyl(octanoyl) transferase LipB [Candidatus Eiseniibacteriota bacterium]
MNELNACALGSLAYRDGLRLQEHLTRARAQGETGDWLLFPDHPSVLTMGRGGHAESVKASPETLERLGVELFEVARGGDVTWHGPGQLVGYTVCDLNARERDLHRFLRDLEGLLIDVLAEFQIDAGRIAGRTGVWVQESKIGSIGVAVRRWVSYHGFALNVCPDLRHFDLIHPCGLKGIQMTSVAALLGPAAPALDQVRVRTAMKMAENMGYDGVRWAPADEVWRAAGTKAQADADAASFGASSGRHVAA